MRWIRRIDNDVGNTAGPAENAVQTQLLGRCTPGGSPIRGFQNVSRGAEGVLNRGILRRNLDFIYRYRNHCAGKFLSTVGRLINRERSEIDRIASRAQLVRRKRSVA